MGKHKKTSRPRTYDEVDFLMIRRREVVQFTPVSQRAKDYARTDLNLDPVDWAGESFFLHPKVARPVLLLIVLAGLSVGN